MSGPYRTAQFSITGDPCKFCRYALDPQVYDDAVCMHDADYPACHGPYLGPEPTRLGPWLRLKKWLKAKWKEVINGRKA